MRRCFTASVRLVRSYESSERNVTTSRPRYRAYRITNTTAEALAEGDGFAGARSAGGLGGSLEATPHVHQTASYLKRFTLSMFVPSMRMSFVAPSRRGEWRSPSL